MLMAEGDILNISQSSKMDTVGHVDGKQTTKAPIVFDGLKAMLQVRHVLTGRTVAI